jgi:HlyD family secretion protein
MKKRFILIVVALAAVAGIAWYWPRGDRADELQLHGTVEVQEVRLGSRLGGRVAKVNVREGDVVEPGHVLVTFEADEWAAKKDQAVQQLAAARAALARAERGPLDEEIQEAKAAADAAGARAARARNGSREEQKRQARADLDGALAEQLRAETEHDRLRRTPLAVSQSEVDAAAAARDSAREKVKSARAMLDQTMRGNRAEEIDEAKAEHARLTARYEFIRRGTREEDKASAYAAASAAQAVLDQAVADLRESTIAAPERCVVQTLPVRAGSLVQPGQPVAVIHRAEDLWVKVFVPSADLGKIRLGQAVAVGVDSHPDTRFAGEVTHVSAVSEFTPRNVQSIDERRHQVFAVKVRVTDPQSVFKSGMAAEVFIPANGGK